jgi:hypothetical protein
MPVPSESRSRKEKDELHEILIDLFRRSGGRVAREPVEGDLRPDLVVDYGDKKFLIECKRSSEGRRDRLVPLLSQAVLQAQAMARHRGKPFVPMAVVAAPRISASICDQIKQFAQSYAPGVAVGIIDGEGLRAFVGYGLEALNSKRQLSSRNQVGAPSPSVHLFSDLNQWMLKVLLSPQVPDSMLSAPRGEYRNASQLAEAAGVSAMSAFRLVRQLSKEGFLDDSGGFLNIVRAEELMQLWLSASRRVAKEVPARWIIPGGENQLNAALKSYSEPVGRAAQSKGRGQRSHAPKRPRLCLGLFAAAKALGLGFVHGVQPYLYIESLDDGVLRQLGLSLQDAEHSPDVHIRIPDNSEAVFRAAVHRDGLAIADILQIWLDVSNHPSRGREQADHIRHRALKRLFGQEPS